MDWNGDRGAEYAILQLGRDDTEFAIEIKTINNNTQSFR